MQKLSKKTRLEKVCSVAIIGKGRVGGSLAKRLSDGLPGYRLHSFLSARSANFRKLSGDNGPEVIIIATRDAAIAPTSKLAVQVAGPNLRLIVHTAGSLPSSILPKRKGVLRLTLHPIQSFPKADATLLSNISFMAASKDSAAIKWAKNFTKALQASDLLRLSDDALPLYHAMLVFAGNFATLLGGVVEELSARLGIAPKRIKKAIAPLMLNSVRNVLNDSAKHVLTGPIARKDLATIRRHRKALANVSPEIRKLYDAFVQFGLHDND